MHCPGHIGHIKLISTCYNPFTIKLLHKLIKSKCFDCHRLRVFPKRIELFEIRFQLIQLGHLIEAARLGEYTDFGTGAVDAAIRILKKKLIKKSNKKGEEENEENTNEEHDKALTALEKFSEIEKDNREIFFAHVKSILEDKNKKPITNTSITTAVRKLVKELLLAIIPSRCPHCETRNPRIKKDGATKFFQHPLSQKDLKANKKTERTIEMTTLEAFSQDEDDEEEDEKTDGQTLKEEEVSEKKLKYLNPIEIKEHMRKLWDSEDTLLQPLFGPYTIFFMNTVLVSPNRFRPESSGGKQAGDDREFLHAHSAMLTRILKTNQSLRKCIEHKEKLVPEETKGHETASERSRAQSTEIDRKEFTSKDVIRHWIDLQDAIN